MADPDPWKRRFFIFMVIRLFGLIVFFAGLAIAYTDWVREGGWPQVGAIVALMGAIDAIWAPILLKRGWDRADREGRP